MDHSIRYVAYPVRLVDSGYLPTLSVSLVSTSVYVRVCTYDGRIIAELDALLTM